MWTLHLEFMFAKAPRKVICVPQLLRLPAVLQASDDNGDARLLIQLYEGFIGHFLHDRLLLTLPLTAGMQALSTALVHKTLETYFSMM